MEKERWRGGWRVNDVPQHVVDEGREKTSYRIRFDGSKRYVIYKRKNHYTLYLPGEYDSEIHLSINKDGYREVDDLLMTYESQKSEGIQAQLAEYKRDDHLEYSVDKLEGKDEYVNEKCGTSLTTAVDWDAISNEQMMSMSIQGFCGQVADTMASLCQTDEAVKAAVSGITQVRCSIGDSLSISREENAIVFRTDKDTANQRDIISDFLRQL